MCLYLSQAREGMEEVNSFVSIFVIIIGFLMLVFVQGSLLLAAVYFHVNVLWDADPLLGNDRETSKTTQQPLQSNGSAKTIFPRQKENTGIIEETFSTRSMPRY
jgi:hypothetical protein